jgi:hypothetical protein
LSDQNDQRRKRGEVIEKTINIEVIIDAIICQAYLKRVVASFTFEVLNDEQFSFGLKVRILEKILPDPDSKRLHVLRRLNTIRNYFAHCNLVYLSVGDDEARLFDPRKPDRSLDLDRLYDEFCSIEPTLTSYLAKKYTEMGGEMLENLPGSDNAG